MKKYRVVGIKNIKTGNSVNYLSSFATFRNDYVVLLQNIQTGNVEEYFYSNALSFTDDIIGYYDNWWVVIDDNLWRLLDLIDFEVTSINPEGVAKLQTVVGLILVNNNEVILSVHEEVKIYDNIIFEKGGICVTIFTILMGLYEYCCQRMDSGVDIYISYSGSYYKLVYDKRLIRFLTKVKVLNKNETSKIN